MSTARERTRQGKIRAGASLTRTPWSCGGSQRARFQHRATRRFPFETARRFPWHQIQPRRQRLHPWQVAFCVRWRPLVVSPRRGFGDISGPAERRRPACPARPRASFAWCFLSFVVVWDTWYTCGTREEQEKIASKPHIS